MSERGKPTYNSLSNEAQLIVRDDELEYQQGFINAARSGFYVYKTTVPLRQLGSTAAPVDCPACGLRGLTLVRPHTGHTTHAWAAGLFFTTFIFTTFPYMFSQTKDVIHRCGRCGIKLAKWHRSGRTEVKAYA